MALPSWLHPDGDGSTSRIEVHAVPGAARDALAGVHGDRLKVRISAPPEDGRANAALRDLLAGSLGVAAREIELLRGASSRSKTFRVGLDPATVAERLGPPV